jgi:hypothetical protein
LFIPDISFSPPLMIYWHLDSLSIQFYSIWIYEDGKSLHISVFPFFFRWIPYRCPWRFGARYPCAARGYHFQVLLGDWIGKRQDQKSDSWAEVPPLRGSRLCTFWDLSLVRRKKNRRPNPCLVLKGPSMKGKNGIEGCYSLVLFGNFQAGRLLTIE